jgi:exodeoxyribonuclease V alpha subunit
LQSHGVGTARAVRIFKTYGESAVEKVQENPYRLALEIHGIGFKTADIIAGRLGIAKDSLIRARAGVLHVLQSFSGEGHCAAFIEKLTTTSMELLEIPEDIIAQAIQDEIKTGQIYCETVEGKTYLFLMSLFQAEMLVAEHLHRLSKGKPAWGELDAEKAIEWAETKTHCKLSTSQHKAVTQALQSKLMVITGGPGVGKTTVVKTILTALRAKGTRILLCAPTGRAAKRLSEATGLEAKTIHRQLEFQPNNFTFKYNHNHPWATDYVIVDESSMLDITLMNHLLKAIPSHASLLLIGDVDQLPSVGPGAVLSDIIQSGQVPTVFLKEIFRQAAHSRIIVNAHRINQGEIPIYSNEEGQLTDFYFIPAETPEMIHDKLLHVVAERIPKRFKLDPLRDIQVLTPMNRGGIGARALNIALQERLNARATPKVSRFGWTFAPGDKVMQLVNNYDKNVFNGDIGLIESIDLEEGAVFIQFDDRLVEYEFNELDELSLAYATSIHKSQGSEYPAVVIPIAMQHYMMLARNLLYTGVTRGKQLVVMIGQLKAVAMAINQVQANQRLTRLAARIQTLSLPLSESILL